jgi:hypothetical protein
MEKVKTAA